MRATFIRDALGRSSGITYRMGDGTTTVADSVVRTQSGRVTNDITASGGNELWNNYGYDAAGRLTTTGIGGNSFGYGFGTQDSTSCGSGNGTNTNSGKNGNRTSQTINGVTTYFCYDYADRLIGSSNALYNSPVYDSRGDMIQIGTGTTPLHLFYDSSGRSSGYEQYNSSTTGVGLYYDRDVQGRIIGRYKDTITNGSWAGAGNWYYHYTGSGSAPDYVRDSSWAIVEKNLQLPGGLLLTIKPTQTGNNQKQYSLPGVLGRTLLTADAVGTSISNGNGPLNSFTYDPFGNPLAGSVLPANTVEGSYGYGGSLQKIAETNFALAPIQMGARTYFSVLGRFTSGDPVPGGAANAYAYALDPINSNDYSGMCVYVIQCTATVYQLQPAAMYTAVQNTAPIAAIQNAGSRNIQAKAPQSIVPRRVSAPIMAQVAPIDMSKIPVAQTARAGGPGSVPVDPHNFSIYSATNSAVDYYGAGQFVGVVIGCGVGTLMMLYAAPVGCTVGAPVGSAIVAPMFAGVGFLLGGYGLSGGDFFEGMPDATTGIE